MKKERPKKNRKISVYIIWDIAYIVFMVTVGFSLLVVLGVYQTPNLWSSKYFFVNVLVMIIHFENKQNFCFDC